MFLWDKICLVMRSGVSRLHFSVSPPRKNLQWDKCRSVSCSAVSLRIVYSTILGVSAKCLIRRGHRLTKINFCDDRSVMHGL